MSKKPPIKIPKVINAVHKDTVFNENIRKEMKYFDKNRMEHFQLNPNNSISYVSYVRSGHSCR